MKSQQNRNICWRIIGPVQLVYKFAEDLLTINDTELYAAASRSQQKAGIFAEQYRVPHTYSSDDALLNEPNIDAAYITTPYSLYKKYLIKIRSRCYRVIPKVLCNYSALFNNEAIRQCLLLTLLINSYKN